MKEQKFNILIVEDEKLVANDIAARLKHAGYHISGIADNYITAIALFNVYLPDLVLLDINIKGDKNGIHIAAEINNTLPTPFIFITAHTDSDTLQKAKNTFPSAYLVKPFTTAHLSVSIDLALHNFAYQKKTIKQDVPTAELEEQEENLYLKQDFIFIKDGQNYIKIKQDDVLVLEAQDNYVKIHTSTRCFLIRCTLNKSIEKFKQPNFIRVHRSFYINLDRIVNFTEQEVTVDQIIVPIGRNYKEEFIKRFELK